MLYRPHRLEVISPILAILEIEVSNILYNPGSIGKTNFYIFSFPGNIGNLSFSSSCYPGNIWKIDFSYFFISWKYWKPFFTAGGRAGRGRGSGAAEPSGGTLPRYYYWVWKCMTRLSVCLWVGGMFGFMRLSAYTLHSTPLQRMYSYFYISYVITSRLASISNWIDICVCRNCFCFLATCG